MQSAVRSASIECHHLASSRWSRGQSRQLGHNQGPAVAALTRQMHCGNSNPPSPALLLSLTLSSSHSLFHSSSLPLFLSSSLPLFLSSSLPLFLSPFLPLCIRMGCRPSLHMDGKGPAHQCPSSQESWGLATPLDGKCAKLRIKTSSLQVVRQLGPASIACSTGASTWKAWFGLVQILLYLASGSSGGKTCLDACSGSWFTSSRRLDSL